MDILAVLERFGVPVAVAVAFGYFIWKQNQYIQDDLTKDIHSKFNRLEGIIVQLINQQKKMQIELRGIKSQYDALVTIITDLLKGKSNGKN
tara:strand:+ start:175 stop:447 length:273 start_codon:yes stop_codon:yes gene_type:complete